jgi:hypothetical protein
MMAPELFDVDNGPGAILYVEISAVAVLGRLHRVPHIGRDEDERPGLCDTPVFADDCIYLALDHEDQQLVWMVMQFGSGACLLLVQAEMHVTALDDRPFPRREMSRDLLTLQILETMERHLTPPNQRSPTSGTIHPTNWYFSVPRESRAVAAQRVARKA